MAKKKEKMISEDLVREKLNNIQAKVEKLVDGYEGKIERLEKENRNLKSNKATKVKPIDLPGNIEVDIKDKYNTQPKDSLWHNYCKNHRMFRREAFRNVMKSKMFWSLIVVIPMIMTFIEFTVLSMTVVTNGSSPGVLTMMLMDLTNYFMIMPLLLLSLIIFPSYIAMSRENNQLKRFAMLGMSRKQIYWSYIRFTTLFLTIFILFWLGPWVIILNLASNSIYGTVVFENKWSIFTGFPVKYWGSTPSINFVVVWWKWLSNNGFPGVDKLDPAVLVQSYTSFAANVQKTMIEYSDRYVNAMTWQEELGVINDLNNLLVTNNIPFELYAESVNPSLFHFDWASWDPIKEPSVRVYTQYLTLVQFDGLHVNYFIPMFLLAMVGINSVGFNKAMKVTSSRTLMGWGIGIWIFSSFVQMSSGLLYKDVFNLQLVEDDTWSAIINILLFILKWMFLFSPITIIIVGITLVAGFINQPQVLGDTANTVYDQLLKINQTVGLSGIAKEIFGVLDAIKSKEPMFKPNTTKNVFITLSLITIVWETLYVFLNKRKIINFETTR